MTLENFIYSVISGVFGIACAVVVSLVKSRKSVDEKKLQEGVQKIADELNIDSINLFLVEDSSSKNKSRKIKFNFQSKGASAVSTNSGFAYQVVGKSGGVAVVVCSVSHPDMEKRLSGLTCCF